MNNINDFNVVIIGAGPAGCQCARTLAKLGYKILLVEQKTFENNDFSSAATPQETLENLTIEDMMNILFEYNFQKLYKGLGKDLQRKVRLVWQQINNLFYFRE